MKTTINALLLFTLSVGLTTQTANAQWTPIGKMGTGPTDGCFSFGINGKGYVGGGSNSNKFYEYDTATNAWTARGNAPGGTIRGFALSFVANGKGYVCTGDTTGASGTCAGLWMYDPAANSWTPKSPFPGGKRDAGFAFVIDNIAYVGGGFDSGGYWDDFYRYDAAADTWSQLPYLPGGPIIFSGAFTLNHKGYIVMGQTATTTSATEVKHLWEFNPADTSWTAKADFPGAARQTNFAFALGNCGYTGGGMSGYTTVFNDMWRYNPDSNSWKQVEPIPTLYPAWTTAFTVGSNAYVGAGACFNMSGLAATDSFKRYKATPAPATGINQVASLGRAIPYPNPVKDYLYVDGDITKGTAMHIQAMTGKTVKTLVWNGNLYVGDLPKGMYMLRYVGEVAAYTAGFIKE